MHQRLVLISSAVFGGGRERYIYIYSHPYPLTTVAPLLGDQPAAKNMPEIATTKFTLHNVVHNAKHCT